MSDCYAIGPDYTWDQILDLMLEYFEGGAWESAMDLWLHCDLEADERVKIWGHFDSRQRSFLKGVDRKYLTEEELWKP